MKNTKNSLGMSIVLALVLSSSIQMFAMEALGSKSNQPLLQVYFSPQDQQQITNSLHTLLDNVQRRLRIAIYWMTDKTILEKIIAAKRRNIDVEIVMDGTSPEIDNIIAQLLQNNIIPVVDPSDVLRYGKMHHKFVVVDDVIVFTGSANFTQIVLNPNAKGLNFENALIINSSDIAKQYTDAFVDMGRHILQFYIDLIASTKNINELPSWMQKLAFTIYQSQPFMQQLVTQMINNYDLVDQRRVRSFFGIQSVEKQSFERRDLITPNQYGYLKSRGFLDEEISDLSKQDAFAIVGKIKSHEDPVTIKQRTLLRDKGFSNVEILGLSKQEASRLIGQVLNQGKQGY
ncbi:MAG TPA: phospholipase D-like domain-containing protein [Candidatus Babeliales bacterium]|jgi:hypothetical protein|nr:phospholipase D-like domain-containing protein [Candidatus Babeliales bacterium]